MTYQFLSPLIPAKLTVGAFRYDGSSAARGQLEQLVFDLLAAEPDSGSNPDGPTCSVKREPRSGTATIHFEREGEVHLFTIDPGQYLVACPFPFILSVHSPEFIRDTLKVFVQSPQPSAPAAEIIPIGGAS